MSGDRGRKAGRECVREDEGKRMGWGWGGRKMSKACLLSGSRRQRQKNLDDREMLVVLRGK